jgi:hypothetical protein
LRRPYVSRLAALIASSQENYQFLPLRYNPVAGAIVDSQFHNAFTDSVRIARIPFSQAVDPSQYSCACIDVG